VKDHAVNEGMRGSEVQRRLGQVLSAFVPSLESEARTVNSNAETNTRNQRYKRESSELNSKWTTTKKQQDQKGGDFMRSNI
jgi:hypothetical protein